MKIELSDSAKKWCSELISSYRGYKINWSGPRYEEYLSPWGMKDSGVALFAYARDSIAEDALLGSNVCFPIPK